MNTLISKDDDLNSSAPVIGFEILNILNEHEGSKISIFEIAKKLHKQKKFSPRSIYYGMIFLFALDILDFDEPYLILNASTKKTI